MARSFQLYVVVVAVLALAMGCQSATGKSAGTVVDDTSITASVKAKLVADTPANLTRVDVDTNNVKTVVNNLQVIQRR